MKGPDLSWKTVDDFQDYETGIAYLFGSVYNLMGNLLSHKCSEDFARREFATIADLYQELHMRFVVPLLDQPDEQPPERLARL